MHSHLKPIVSLLLRPSRQIDSKVICHSRIQISLASRSPDVLPLVTAERWGNRRRSASGGNRKRYAFGVRLTVWLWLNQPNSAGKHSFSGNDKAVSLRDSIAQVGCLSGNRHHERTPSTRTQQEPNLALFFSWSFSRIEVLAHRATSMFIALQLSWH